MKRVLFLCTGNSCRSQMAEAIINARMGDTWQAFSAGTQPTDYVHPNAIRALAEIGIGISGARSKSAEEFHDAAFDLVVTVCDTAAKTVRCGWAEGSAFISAFPIRPKPVERTNKSWRSFVRCATILRLKCRCYYRSTAANS